MDKEKLKNALEAILSDDSSGDLESGDNSHSDQSTSNQEQGSQEQDELTFLRKQTNNDARNLRLKFKAEKEKREAAEAELQKYKQAEEQAKLSELSEVEKYKELLAKEQSEKSNLLTAKEKAELESYQKDVDNLIVKAGIHDEDDIDLIRPALLKKLQDDDFNAKEFFDKLKKKSPGMFAQGERTPGSVGTPPQPNRGKEFSQQPERKKWGGRSESLADRKDFDKNARQYGITVQKRY